VAIVAARWHAEVVEQLLEGAQATLLQAGVAERHLTVHRCPGTFEIPVVAAGLARLRRHDAVIALGCVIRGETPHFEYVAGPVAYMLQAIQTETAIPVIFGVLTTDTLEQALARSGGQHGNKGVEAALAAIEMAHVMRKLQ
jgi:6,7-dimethyl-8-ribityllumazine synthase